MRARRLLSVARFGPLGALLLAGCAPSPGGTMAPVDGATGSGGSVAANTGGASAPGTGGGSGGGTGNATATGGGSGNGAATGGGSGGASTGGAQGSGGAGPGSGGSSAGGRVGTPGGGTGGATSPVDGGSAGAPGATTDGGAATPSPGCGLPVTDPANTPTRHTLMVGTVTREYYVRLPAMYNSSRLYPVVFVWHGAGGSGMSGNIPIQTSSGANALVVGGTALVDAAQSRTQWQTGASSPDLAFFDALVAEVSAHYCVDRSRLFSAGYSSGAWFSNLLGCVRGDVMRAYGVVAGGMPGRLTCTPGGIAAWFMHDQNDTENVIAGNITARTRLLTANGCGTTTTADTPVPCVRYDGCRDGRPVVWCETMGAGHSAQSALSGPGMWRFFSSF